MTERSPPKTRGRPIKYETKRPQMNFRLRADLHERLRGAAESSGLSMSEEIERRLERSFSSEDDLGGAHVAALARMVAASVVLAEKALGASWVEDAKVRSTASAAITRALDGYANPSFGLFGLSPELGLQLRLRQVYADALGEAVAETVAAVNPRARFVNTLALALMGDKPLEEVIANLKAAAPEQEDSGEAPNGSPMDLK